MVSRRVSYSWRCLGCERVQEAPVWRILDSRERSDVIAQPGTGVGFVVCLECETAAEIDVPVLIIRPEDPLPLLLGVHLRELSSPFNDPPSGPMLEQEARAALGRDTAGITGPIIPLPRILLSVVLTRDVKSDAEDPDRAVSEIFGPETTPPASWYRSFLRVVQDSESERRLTRAFAELLNVSPPELEAFLCGHPELNSADAVAAARTQLDAVPPPSEEEDPILGGFRILMQARLELVASLLAGTAIEDAVVAYVAKLERSSESFKIRLEQLLGEVSAEPGAAGIPQLRAALDMAAGVKNEDMEADLSADLGVRLLSQPVTDNASIEESISLLVRALSLIPEGDPRWIKVASNLGNAYKLRVSGDAIENWENARRLLQRACDEFDRSTDPREWALLQMNCGFLLGDHPGGSSPSEIDQGIAHIRASLEERSPERNVIDWAYSLVNLGLLHQRRGAAGDDAIARACYEQALGHLRPSDDLQLWTTLEYNWVDVLLVTGAPDLDSAEPAIRSALGEVNAATDPVMAGRLTWQLARFVDRAREPLSPESLQLRRDALHLLSPSLAPAWHLRIGGELADAYSQLNDWPAAAAVFTSMLTAFDTLYDVQTSQEGRRMVLKRSPRLARWAAYAFARIGRPEDAVEVLERSRARQLSVSVSRDTADLARLAAVDQQLAHRYRTALAQYRAALDQAGATLLRTGAENRVVVAENDVRRALSEIRDVPGFEKFLLPMTVAGIGSAGDGHPVVYLVSAPAGSYVLTVQVDASGKPTVTSVSVPEVTSRDIALLVLVGENGKPGLISAQSAGPWLNRVLPAALRRLREIEPLLRPVADVLTSTPGHIAVVIPSGLLGLIPITAAVVSGQILDDVGEIHLAPSAAVYAATRKRASQQRPQHLVAVADPDGTLRGSRAELAAIRSLFEPGTPVTCAVGADATRAWVLDNVAAASHLHLACHGASIFGSTIGGMLRLADDDALTIDDLLDGRLGNCRLAVASACQSGHYDTSAAPDEFTGLPAGFLQAGAACAVVSLWQVRDDVTSLLMTRFYELLDPNLGGDSQRPVSALRQARKWLRQLTPEQAEAFRQAHPQLAEVTDGQSESAPATPSHALGASSPESWAAFVAWGC